MLPRPDFDACWHWPGAHDPEGRATYNRRFVTRLLWIMFGGDPAAPHLHHTCEHPWCVNPWHLESLTPSEHGERHGAQGERCKHGHLWAAGNTRWITKANGRMVRVCVTCGNESSQRWRKRSR